MTKQQKTSSKSSGPTSPRRLRTDSGISRDSTSSSHSKKSPKLKLVHRAKAKQGDSGIQVSFRLQKSKYGLGIFVQEDIPKGSILWKYKRGVNVKSYKTEEETRAYLDTLPSAEAKTLWLDYAYHDGECLNAIQDEGKYWNHSSNPNSCIGWPGASDQDSSYALRDIKKGEELFEDYGSYKHPSWLVNLCSEFGSDMSYYEIKEDVAAVNDKNAKAGFHVKYRLGQSKFGLGLFAEEDIAKGKLIWKSTRGENVISFRGEKAVQKHLDGMSTDKERQDFLIHAWMDGGKLNYSNDDAIYWNHSEKPNTGFGPGPESCQLSTYAVCDIKKGEEMFDDYGTYQWPKWHQKLLAKYDVDISYFVQKPEERIKFLQAIKIN